MAIIVLMITLNLRVSLSIIFTVLLVDYFIVAVIYFWDMTLNADTGMNLIFALGLCVDYSSHIAYNY